MKLPFLRFLLTIATFLCLVRCDTSPWIFPHVSNSSIPNVSNLTFHSNDSVIVEYTQFPYTTAVSIEAACFDSVQHAVGNETYEYGAGYGPFNNTGKIKWNFTTVSDIIYSEPCEETQKRPCPPPDLTYCQFILYNGSIDSCSWGPWGLGSLEYSLNRTKPLYYSPVFRVLAAANNTKPTLWINAADKTASSVPASKTASTTVNITCPPLGIPPSTTIIAHQTNIWPPMASNLTFPVWIESDDD